MRYSQLVKNDKSQQIVERNRNLARNQKVVNKGKNKLILCKMIANGSIMKEVVKEKNKKRNGKGSTIIIKKPH